MVLSRTGVDVMSEQHFTRPNVKPVITYIGTTPEQRQMSTDEFKAKFDEMTVNLQNYIKEVLLRELDDFKTECETQFNRLQHYNAIRIVPYESADNRWRDISGVGFYYAGTSNVGYPQVTGILIHFKLPVTAVTWQVFIGNSGQIWTRRVSASANFADVEWIQV